MQSIDYSGLDELDRRFAAVLKERPELRKQMHTEVAQELKYEVFDQIDRVGIKQSRGRARSEKDPRPPGSVRDWQYDDVGSGGGYAAVRVIDAKRGGGTGPNSAGAITNYLENGHKVRPPSGNAKRHRKSRARQQYVRGFYFYTATRDRAQQVALDAANRYAERIAEEIGD